ncbi:hypothetical protein KHQ06_29435 [Nocardia tengchongensis]|uniref:Arsenate reductase n=1 Tax=Nocardia tengchongensis TaxID=2055889 RepID=A0ABX8CJY2_9NOCA|nr:hypothetical protein [Nocardia tengchongensis]QVI20284.1 hypothetical protein KHQ06_29435 [Nocardia tengchongensis]
MAEPTETRLGELSGQSWVPVEACALPTAEQPLRVAEFDALFREAVRGMERVSPTSLRLRIDAAAEARARELTDRESSCCSFFRFEFATAGPDLLHLEIGVPAARIEVLDGLAARVRAAGTA